MSAADVSQRLEQLERRVAKLEKRLVDFLDDRRVPYEVIDNMIYLSRPDRD